MGNKSVGHQCWLLFHEGSGAMILQVGGGGFPSVSVHEGEDVSGLDHGAVP